MTTGTEHKAINLVEEHRVVQLPTMSSVVSEAVVAGEHSAYLVTAQRRGVSCTCPATDRQGRYCSHMLAAMVCWAEGRGHLS